MVKHRLRVLEVVGSIPGQNIPTTLKMAGMAFPPSSNWDCWVSIETDLLCQDKWTISTGNLTWKCHDITEQLLLAALNTIQTN